MYWIDYSICFLIIMNEEGPRVVNYNSVTIFLLCFSSCMVFVDVFEFKRLISAWNFSVGHSKNLFKNCYESDLDFRTGLGLYSLTIDLIAVFCFSAILIFGANPSRAVKSIKIVLNLSFFMFGPVLLIISVYVFYNGSVYLHICDKEKLVGYFLYYDTFKNETLRDDFISMEKGDTVFADFRKALSVSNGKSTRANKTNNDESFRKLKIFKANRYVSFNEELESYEANFINEIESISSARYGNTTSISLKNATKGNLTREEFEEFIIKNKIVSSLYLSNLILGLIISLVIIFVFSTMHNLNIYRNTYLLNYKSNQLLNHFFWTRALKLKSKRDMLISATNIQVRNESSQLYPFMQPGIIMLLNEYFNSNNREREQQNGPNIDEEENRLLNA